ncbi:MAG: TPM domain-containing protein [Gemmatimonas sp.]
MSRPAVAQGPEQLPAPTGYVNDFAAVLGQGSRTALEDLARRVNVATKGDMVIVTLRDIGDRAPAEMALTIGRQWKVGANAEIGDRARNAGTIILVVPKETASTGRGSCFIGTGQGTEGFITDATAGSICREATAFFRTQDYDTGIRLLAQRVAERYAQEFNVSLDGVSVPPPQQRARESQRQRNGSGIIGLIVVVFILMSLGGRGRGGGLLSWLPFLIASSSHGGRRHDGWGGGGFGGGGGGFGGFGGGGGFSGGGGGSDW